MLPVVSRRSLTFLRTTVANLSPINCRRSGVIRIGASEESAPYAIGDASERKNPSTKRTAPSRRRGPLWFILGHRLLVGFWRPRFRDRLGCGSTLAAGFADRAPRRAASGNRLCRRGMRTLPKTPTFQLAG